MNGLHRSVAGWLVDRSCRIQSRRVSDRLNLIAAKLCPEWSVPWYNLGFSAKYAGDWLISLEHNRRAAECNPSDEAAWWNMGIAATALSDWAAARRAWDACGIELSDDTGEPRFPAITACVRVNPNGNGEVVWGHRIDPVRLRIDSIPLPESEHRYRDTVLHDGAQEGTRIVDGTEVPVFDELAVWQTSCYSTFEAVVEVPDEVAEKDLVQRCLDQEMGIEDWSTVRWICEECSRGNPGPHSCAHTVDSARRSYAFASESAGKLEDVLQQWVAANAGAQFGSVRIRLKAGERS